MHPPIPCRPAVAALVLGCGGMACAWAQGLEPQLLKAFGGVYATACGQPDAPTLTVAARTLTLSRGGKRLEGGHLDTQFAYFGGSAQSEIPKGFQFALMAQQHDGRGLNALVWKDARGPYLTLEEDRKAMAARGARAPETFRRCGP